MAPQIRLKFVHVTDPHLVGRGQSLFELDPRARLDRCIESINAHHADASFCLWTGDLAHLGEDEAYEQIRECMGALQLPSYLVVGNHDLREGFHRAFPEVPVDDNGFVQYRFETTVGSFIVIDTVDEGVQSGYLCADRLKWLDNELEATRGEDVYLVLHHSPMAVGIAAMDAICLRNADELARLLGRFDHVRHLFHGHLHRACHGTWQGIPFSTVKATAYQIALTLDPASGMIASCENPAYAVVLVTDTGVILHDHSYLEEHLVFSKAPHRPGGT